MAFAAVRVAHTMKSIDARDRTEQGSELVVADLFSGPRPWIGQDSSGPSDCDCAAR
jgi:hypothetical protein